MDKPVHFTVDHQLVGPTQNTLAHLARVTAGCDGPGSARWPVARFKTWLAEHGVAEPSFTVWGRTLPNGRVVGTVLVPPGYALAKVA